MNGDVMTERCACKNSFQLSLAVLLMLGKQFIERMLYISPILDLCFPDGPQHFAWSYQRPPGSPSQTVEVQDCGGYKPTANLLFIDLS